MMDTGTANDQGMRVGSAPINWGVYRLDPNNPPPDALLDAIAAAGYAGCELGPVGYLASSVDDLSSKFSSRGLALVSAFVATDLGQPLTPAFEREFGQVAMLLQAGGAPTILLSDGWSEQRFAATGRVEQHPHVWWSDDEWRQAFENINALTERAGKHALTLSFHPHVATHVESEREIERLLAGAGAEMRLCLDTGHMLIGGADPGAILDAAAGRVAHVHAKDVDPAILARLRSGEIDYSTAVSQGIYCDLGDGAIDWKQIASRLARAGYDAWLVVEQDRRLTPGDPGPGESPERNRRFVRAAFGV